MVVIGITGAIGHGKTTFGHDLQLLETHATHYDSSQIITNLAQAWIQASPNLPSADDYQAINAWLADLIPVIKQMFGLDCQLDQIKLTSTAVAEHPGDYQKLFAFLKQPSSDLSIPGEVAKETYRTLLQWLGGYLVKKIDPGIWYNYIADQIKTDHQEGIVLCTVGGLRYPNDAQILKTVDAVIVEIKRPDLEEIDASDMTERERRNIAVDTVVINNGSLTDLQNCAKRLYEDIKAQKLQSYYDALNS